MKLYSVLIVQFLISTILAQSYKSGLMLEYVSYNTNHTQVKYNKGMVTDSSSEKIFLGGSYLSYSGKMDLGEDFDFEFRPGFVLTSSQLAGIQLGVFLRKRVSNIIILGGYSYISNFYSSHGIENFEMSPGDFQLIILGVGYSLSKSFNLLANYQKKSGSIFLEAAI